MCQKEVWLVQAVGIAKQPQKTYEKYRPQTCNKYSPHCCLQAYQKYECSEDQLILVETQKIFVSKI